MKKKVKKERIMNVFSDDLPRWGKGGKAKEGSIDWSESIGWETPFQYNDVCGKVKIIDYNPKTQHLYIKYEDKEPFKIARSSFLQGRLGKLLDKITDEFKIEIGTTFKDDKRDLTIIDREYKNSPYPYKKDNKLKYYKYKCNKCGYDDGWVIETHLLNGQSCSCCENRTVVKGINDIPTTAPWMVKFFQGGYDEAKMYTKGSYDKIYPVCPDCGRIKNKEMKISDINRCKSINCTCGDGFSYGHKYVYSLLSQLNLSLQENKRFHWCKFPSYKDKNKVKIGEYDFFVENMKLIIEVDGEFHRKDNCMNGQTKEHSKYLDDMKDLKAHENGYKIVRISDEDSIKDNILKSKLVNLVDLSKIDWLKCEEYALSNRGKQICDLKKDNPNITATEIGKIMGLEKTTIRKYLKKGNDLGWCNYDAKEEMKKSALASNELKRKKIEIFKDGVSLGVFESAMELERQSINIFGVKLLVSMTSKVCNSKKPQYKGFTFKYV